MILRLRHVFVVVLVLSLIAFVSLQHSPLPYIIGGSSTSDIALQRATSGRVSACPTVSSALSVNRTANAGFSTVEHCQKTNDGCYLEEAYVGFINKHPKFLPLMEVLIESVHVFSTRPIIVYCIQFECPWPISRFPRLVPRYMEGTRRSIYYNKVKMMILAPVRYAVQVEADHILNWKADDLFTMIRRHVKTHDYPLLSRHAYQERHIKVIKYRPGLDPDLALPYHQAHVLFSDATRQFAVKTLENSLNGDYDEDEMALNYELWKTKARVGACHFSVDFRDWATYFKQLQPARWVDPPEWLAPNDVPSMVVAFHLYHHIKEGPHARFILERLKEHRGKMVYSNGTHLSADLDSDVAKGCVFNYEGIKFRKSTKPVPWAKSFGFYHLDEHYKTLFPNVPFAGPE